MQIKSKRGIFFWLLRMIGVSASQRHLLLANRCATAQGDTLGQLMMLQDVAPRIVVRKPVVPKLNQVPTRIVPDFKTIDNITEDINSRPDYPEWDIRLQ